VCVFVQSSHYIQMEQMSHKPDMNKQMASFTFSKKYSKFDIKKECAVTCLHLCSFTKTFIMKISKQYKNTTWSLYKHFTDIRDMHLTNHAYL